MHRHGSFSPRYSKALTTASISHLPHHLCRFLLRSYPEWKPVCAIPGLDADGQAELARHLYDVGVLLVKDADDSDDDDGVA
jgi:hypothetical protein